LQGLCHHRWRRRLCAAAFAALLLPKLAYLALCVLFPFPQRHLERLANPAAAPRVLDRKGNTLGAFVAADDCWSFPVPLSEISPSLIKATIAAEDKRFYSHDGVDYPAVARAAWSNLWRGRTVSGASTLTMQTIRLLEPRRRTLWAKLVEAFRARQLEGRRSKDEILAGYLNLAPYGGNLVGAEAASLAWFGKRARDLTIAEAALLAGLPQAPSRLRPDRFPERAMARRDQVLRQLRIADCGLRIEIRNPKSEIRNPQFALLVRRRHPDKPCLRTTLDPSVQHAAETALREGVAALREAGVSNGAAVVIENECSALRAMVGSCDFFSEEDDGQVNGATAPRSPGSALKPFTYALAFERGLCLPDTVLPDVPASYTGYEPANYDRDFRGAVSAREALAASLNLPAVRLLREAGHRNLHAFLKELGISTLTRDPDHYGLALTLGSVEVTLLELTQAYATLARLGLSRPLRFLEDEPVAEGQRVLSEGAAYLVADILSDTTRLGGKPLWRSAQGQLRMAWKTGTSHGHRDAWTIAYTPRHTVGVWLGNFSGRPARGLVGIQAAAPIAARILDQVEAGQPAAWFPKPDSVELRPLCAASGLPPGPHCPATRPGLWLNCGLAIADCGLESEIRNPKSEESHAEAAEEQRQQRRSGSGLRSEIGNRKSEIGNRKCPAHVSVKVDAATGARLCPRCAGGKEQVTRVAEAWPPELAAWLRRHGQGRDLLPEHNPQCTAHCGLAIADCGLKSEIRNPKSEISDAPHILSPANGQTYLLLPDAAEQRLQLRAASRAPRLYWFVGGALFATAGPLDPAFWPLARGTHRITCADDAGNAATVTVCVR